MGVSPKIGRPTIYGGELTDMDGDENSGFLQFNLLTNSRQDNHGISTLKDSENTLHSGNVKKANLLNSQFQSIFSCLSPLRIGQLCIQNICNIFQENVPEDINPKCPAMPEIKVDLNSVLKLLSNLKPDKAAGPDSIKPMVLKQLKMEIFLLSASCLKKLFKSDNSLQSGKKRKSVPYSKRVTKQNHQIIGPFL